MNTSAAQQLNLFNKSSRLEQHEIRIIINNLDRTNREISQMIQRSESSVANFLHKQGIKRTAEQVEQIRSRIDLSNENNPRWLGGISKNNYRYREIQRKKFPEKHNARLRVYYAVKTGKLIKQNCCCCNRAKSEFHHYDYELPLSGYWLCRREHKIWDNLLRAGIEIGAYLKYAIPVIINGYHHYFKTNQDKLFQLTENSSFADIQLNEVEIK